MHIGSEVTRWFRKEREPHVLMVTPERLIAALHRAGINCVLMGTHGINGYRDEARATQDVDVLVVKKDVRKAVRTLQRLFPKLEVRENASVARFFDTVTGKVVIDVIKPSSRAMQMVFRNSIPIGKTHRIPTLEMAVISKFLAMQGTRRTMGKRMQDATDMVNMVVQNRRVLDVARLKQLADHAQPRGGDVITGLIADIDAGRAIEIT